MTMDRFRRQAASDVFDAAPHPAPRGGAVIRALYDHLDDLDHAVALRVAWLAEPPRYASTTLIDETAQRLIDLQAKRDVLLGQAACREADVRRITEATGLPGIIAAYLTVPDQEGLV